MSAVISDCGQYRYRLDRAVAVAGPVYAFFGINPSTADANLDDATVRKWRGFVSRWGGSRFIVGNVFALRATDVKALATAPLPAGPENHEHLATIAREADVLVPCWGDSRKLPKHLRPDLVAVLDRLYLFRKPVKTFGFTKGGDPLHPLMLAYSTPLVDISGAKP
jgi:hypothetical protein